jgi:hypothetical protein
MGMGAIRLDGMRVIGGVDGCRITVNMNNGSAHRATDSVLPERKMIAVSNRVEFIYR